MYGYVRPVKGELKVSELERFRGVYCGLCHELARRYGFWSRFLVNYDFTFLAMLLAEDAPARTCPRRCPAHPFHKTECLESCQSLQTAADMTVVLGWWKLADGAADKSFPASWACRFACRALKGAYDRAVSRQPDFAAAVKEDLGALQTLEKEKCPSLDAAADKFASILRSIAGGIEDPARQRAAGELLYALGRIIYILDAADDLADDIRADSYNPLRYRFAPVDGRLSPEDEKVLRTSMQHSHNALVSAYALMGENVYTGILSNTIYLGLPAATQAVFAGTWNTSAKIHRKRSSI